MFIHRAQIQLKTNSHIELSRKIQQEIMPALRLQKGFCSGVTSIDTHWLRATEDTRWETKADAEAYQQNGYPQVLKFLMSVAENTPTTSIFESIDKARGE